MHAFRNSTNHSVITKYQKRPCACMHTYKGLFAHDCSDVPYLYEELGLKASFGTKSLSVGFPWLFVSICLNYFLKNHFKYVAVTTCSS